MSDLDEYEIKNDYEKNKYYEYLDSKSTKELKQYIIDLDRSNLMMLIRVIYGLDGRHDCSFQPNYGG